MIVLHMKKVWFEKIKTGEKTHEYRECEKNKFLEKFVGTTESQIIRFDLGYCGIDEHKKQIFATMKSIKRLESGKNTDLAIDAPVYDIEFELLNAMPTMAIEIEVDK